jgi:tetratricopeptide (TPR) repeat protein
MKRAHFISWFILLATVLVAYANVYQNEFVYDDEFLIQKNQNIRTWEGISHSFLMSSTGGSGAIDSFYRPLQGVIYTVAYQLHGLYPDGFHLLNVLLHTLCAILIFSLACKLEFSPLACLIGALFWAVHPIHTEAVTYASATADPLYAAFLLAGLLVAAPDFTLTKILWSIPFYIGGMLSKETGIVFPALIIACMFLMSERRWSFKTYIRTLPLWGIALLYLILRKTVLNFDNSFVFYKTSNIYTEHFWYRLLTFFATIPSYLSLLIWPTDLHIDRYFPVYVSLWSAPVLLGIAWLLLGVFVLLWERKSQRPTGSWAFLWFLAAHVPHTGVLLPVNAFFLEHWLYLPSVGLFIALAQVLTETLKESRWILLPVSGVTAILAFATFEQNKVWANPISLYTHILKFNPNVARVHNNLAMAYSDLHEDQLAIEHYNKAIEMSDAYPQTHHNLALLLVRHGLVQEAITHLKRAIELNHDFYQSANVLAQIYHSLGDTQDEQHYIEVYNQALAKFSH